MTDPEVGGKPAPQPLRQVQAFVNAIDLEDPERDRLRTPGMLADWLAAHALLAPGIAIDAPGHGAALEVREALRDLLAANAGEPVAAAAVEVLNRAGREARFAMIWDAEGRSRLEPQAGGVAGAMGRLLAIAFGAVADGTWSRLRACGAHSCRWAFYDHSKNRSGTWCAMRVCGNRMKARSYRRRQKRGERVEA